jgi:hypothetical protein
VTIEAGSNSTALSGAVGPESAASVENAAAPGPKQKSGGLRPRPKTILELIEYSYGEAGKRLNLARKDLRELTVDQQSADAEMAALRRLAAADPFLSVPPSILLALAELGASPSVRRRILELVLAALAGHPVFAAHLERLADPAVEPGLSARDVSDAAKRVTFDVLGLKEAAEFKESARERLRVNAAISFMLFRVLRDGWPLDRFVDDMASVVWTAPSRSRPEDAAAVLAAARSTDALSQLSRHFEQVLADEGRQTAEARASATRESRRAGMAEEENRRLTRQLEMEKRKAGDLSDQFADLTRSLEAERSHRVVDKSHLVDDYEALRTQVIRRLSAQVGLLSDGLHALRNGRTAVAEEFLDRSLTAIEGELTRLKDIDGGGQ